MVFRFPVTTKSNSSSVISSMGVGRRTQGLFTNILTVWNLLSVLEIISSTYAGSDTSPISEITSLLKRDMSVVVFVTVSSSRSFRTTQAQFLAIVCSIARPMPRPAPVTMATFPSKCPKLSSLLSLNISHLNPGIFESPARAYLPA